MACLADDKQRSSALPRSSHARFHPAPPEAPLASGSWLPASVFRSAAASPAQRASAGSRARLLLDFGWRFHLDHAGDPARDFGFGQTRAFAKSGALNGPYLGRNLRGYVPFRYDITDFLNYGGRNVLVVRVDATENEGWFYEGAGIYRHVWLVKTHPVHVAHWGTFVTAEVHAGAATVTISTEVANDGGRPESCRVVSTIPVP